MFLFEQGSLAAHPVTAAEGSHSCASLFPQDGLHDEVVVLLLWVTQQTVPEAQLAWPLHLSADGGLPPPPPVFGHVAPVTHACVKPFPERVKQHVSAGILQVDAPHVSVDVVPVDPPASADVVPASVPVVPASGVPPLPESATPLVLPSADVVPPSVESSKRSPDEPPHATSTPPTTNAAAKNL